MTAHLGDTTNLRRIQNRTIVLLSLAQIFSGIGTGAVLTVGSLLALEISGSEAWSGSVTTLMTLGAALGAMPLANLARFRGRRVALTFGLGLALVGTLAIVLASVAQSFVLLLAAAVAVGIGNTVNLQARFAATDLSEKNRRGRDLSFVVWMSAFGAIAGPNLIGISSRYALSLGLPELAGIFVLSGAGMLIGMSVIWIGLRPDPYLTARNLQRQDTQDHKISPNGTRSQRSGFWAAYRAVRAVPLALTALVGVTVSHAVMIAVMAMTSVHMAGHGAELQIIGITISLHFAGMYLFSPIMGMLTDKLGGRQTVLIGLGMLLIAVLFAGLGSASHTLVTIGLFVLGLGWSAATVSGSALLASSVPESVRVSAQGVSDTLMSLAGALGGFVAGLVLSGMGFGGLNLAAGALVVATVAFVLRPHR